MTGPKSHLAALRPVKHVAFYTGRGLAGSSDSVRRGSHELREIIHRLSPLENDLRQRLLLRVRDTQRDVLYTQVLRNFLRFAGEL